MNRFNGWYNNLSKLIPILRACPREVAQYPSDTCTFDFNWGKWSTTFVACFSTYKTNSRNGNIFWLMRVAKSSRSINYSKGMNAKAIVGEALEHSSTQQEVRLYNDGKEVRCDIPWREIPFDLLLARQIELQCTMVSSWFSHWRIWEKIPAQISWITWQTWLSSWLASLFSQGDPTLYS